MAQRLTTELQNQIATFIRNGAYPHVAAQAAGVPHTLFLSWMERGQRTTRHNHYRLFFLEVQTAHAISRLRAEMALHQDDPRTWLTKGPGKEQPGEPGWSGVVRPLVNLSDNRTLNLLADPQAATLLSAILAALAPFPEARRAAIAALNQSDRQPLTIQHTPVETVLKHLVPNHVLDHDRALDLVDDRALDLVRPPDTTHGSDELLPKPAPEQNTDAHNFDR